MSKYIDIDDAIEHAEVNGEDKDFIRKLTDYLMDAPTIEPKQEWISCSERLPKTDGENSINKFNVLLAVREKGTENEPQVYTGKLRPVKGDDGSGNFWGVKTAPSDWTIWGWSYFREPEVLAWMPLPEPYRTTEDSSTAEQTCETCKHYTAVSVACDRCDKRTHSRYERSE